MREGKIEPYYADLVRFLFYKNKSPHETTQIILVLDFHFKSIFKGAR